MKICCGSTEGHSMYRGRSMSRSVSKVDDGGYGHEKASKGVVSRYYWISGAYASGLSEKRNTFFKAFEK